MTDILTPLEALEPDWDTYDAGPVSKVALSNARTVLAWAKAEGWPEPRVTPEGDEPESKIVMEWQGPKSDPHDITTPCIELVFASHGILWLKWAGNLNESTSDNLYLDSLSVLADLLEWLASVSDFRKEPKP